MQGDNQESKTIIPVRFNTSLYGALAANHALVFEAMQNELEITVGLAERFKQQALAAEQRVKFLTEQTDAMSQEAEQLRRELEQLRGKQAKTK